MECLISILTVAIFKFYGKVFKFKATIAWVPTMGYPRVNNLILQQRIRVKLLFQGLTIQKFLSLPLNSVFVQLKVKKCKGRENSQMLQPLLRNQRNKKTKQNNYFNNQC